MTASFMTDIYDERTEKGHGQSKLRDGVLKATRAFAKLIPRRNTGKKRTSSEGYRIIDFDGGLIICTRSLVGV
jgi:hypothetical protein